VGETGVGDSCPFNYEWVLVRLSQIHLDALRDLIRMAYRLAASSKAKPRRHTR